MCYLKQGRLVWALSTSSNPATLDTQCLSALLDPTFL